MEKFVQLKKDNIVRIGIQTSDGKDTGEHLEFDMEDIELPLRVKQSEIEHQKNINYVRNQFLIIEKKQDKKGKYFMSWKQEEQIKILKEFYQREIKTIDNVLGDGATRKLLNGRNPYYTMYDDINDIIEPILPLLEKSVNNINNKIISKYSNKTEGNVLK